MPSARARRRGTTRSARRSRGTGTATGALEVNEPGVPPGSSVCAALGRRGKPGCRAPAARCKTSCAHRRRGHTGDSGSVSDRQHHGTASGRELIQRAPTRPSRHRSGARSAAGRPWPWHGGRTRRARPRGARTSGRPARSPRRAREAPLDLESLEPDEIVEVGGHTRQVPIVDHRARPRLRVLVPGPTDDPREEDRVATLAAGLGNVGRVDVLPFHKLGAPKYAQLAIPFPLAGTPLPGRELVQSVQARFAAALGARWSRARDGFARRPREQPAARALPWRAHLGGPRTLRPHDRPRPRAARRSHVLDRQLDGTRRRGRRDAALAGRLRARRRAGHALGRHGRRRRLLPRHEAPAQQPTRRGRRAAAR